MKRPFTCVETGASMPLPMLPREPEKCEKARDHEKEGASRSFLLEVFSIMNSPVANWPAALLKEVVP